MTDTPKPEGGVTPKPKPPVVKPPDTLKLLGFISDRDARLGLVLSVFVLIALVAIWVSQALGGATGPNLGELLQTLFWAMIGCAGFVVFFKAIDGTIVPRLILWYVTVLALLTVSVFWVQSILRTPTPFLIEARCFADPWAAGCPFGIVLAKDIRPAPVAAENSTDKSQAPPDPRNRVFIQFAGALARSSVVDLSRDLVKVGWNVQGADRGGERTASAAGVDQVRYFFPGDEALARRLARSYNQKANWDGFDPLSVAFVDGFENRVAPGHLEVWTSVD